MAVISKLCLVSAIQRVLAAARSHRDNLQAPLFMLDSGGRITDATSSRLVPWMRVRGWRVPTVSHGALNASHGRGEDGGRSVSVVQLFGR